MLRLLLVCKCVVREQVGISVLPAMILFDALVHRGRGGPRSNACRRRVVLPDGAAERAYCRLRSPVWTPLSPPAAVGSAAGDHVAEFSLNDGDDAFIVPARASSVVDGAGAAKTDDTSARGPSPGRSILMKPGEPSPTAGTRGRVRFAEAPLVRVRECVLNVSWFVVRRRRRLARMWCRAGVHAA